MKHIRPVNLNLFTMYFPIPAIVSILHRISGIILFFIIPLLLWGLNQSLVAEQSFDEIHQWFVNPFFKFIIWGLLSAFIFHLVAGIRHILMDLGFAEELKSGRLSAQLTILISLILIILTGIWLW